jgi:hypothetical protein
MSTQPYVLNPAALPNPLEAPTNESGYERADERQRIDHLQSVLHRVMRVIEQDRALPVERASALVADARKAAWAMFPDRTAAFELIWWPRLQRVMRERYRMQ